MTPTPSPDSDAEKLARAVIRVQRRHYPGDEPCEQVMGTMIGWLAWWWRWLWWLIDRSQIPASDPPNHKMGLSFFFVDIGDWGWVSA